MSFETPRFDCSGSAHPIPIPIGLPFGLGRLRWMPSRVERSAAWSLYVQLSTQLAALPLDRPTEELRSPRQALASLHRVLRLTREVLSKAGPHVARSSSSFGAIAIAVADRGLRPFLERWHHRLSVYEASRPIGSTRLAHELCWPDYRNFFAELELKQQGLREYADLLARMAGVAQAAPRPH